MRYFSFLALALMLALTGACGDDDAAKARRALLARQAKHPDVRAAVAVAKAQGYDKRWAKLLPVSAMSPSTASFVVLGINVLLPALLLAYIVSRWLGFSLQRRRANKGGAEARAREAIDAGVTTLHGEVVEVEGGGEVALDLLVTQKGKVTGGKNKKTIWREVARQRAQRPFFVVLANGQRLRVEPDDKTYLVDDMTRGTRTGPAERQRRAQLVVGESVYVHGDFARGAAGDAGGAVGVMRPPAKGRMLLSTRPLGDSFAMRARHHGLWAIVALLATCAALYFFHKPFLVGKLLFSEGSAVIIGKSIVKKKRKRGYSTYYVIHVVIAQTGQTFREAMEPGIYRTLRRGTRLPVMYHRSWPRYAQIGRAVSEPTEKVFFSMWLFPLLLVYFMRHNKAVPWYEKPKVIDEESGRMSPYKPPEGGDAQA